MSKPMTQIQIETAVHQIDGYYIRSPWEDEQEANFNKAKAECIKNMEIALANVQSITLEQFLKGTHRI